jgi:hypothetical protein
MTDTEPSFGQSIVPAVAQWGEDIQSRLGDYASDPNTSDTMRFVAAMVSNPARWIPDVATGVAGIGAYVLDDQFRSGVNGRVENFLSNDPTGVTARSIAGYLHASTPLEMARDGVNFVGSGAVGAPVGEAATIVLRGTGDLVLQGANSAISTLGPTASDMAFGYLQRTGLVLNAVEDVGGGTGVGNVVGDAPARNALLPDPNQPLLLTYSSPTTHTVDDILRMQLPDRWQAGEQFIQELYGSTGQQHFSVPAGDFNGEEILGTGGRYVDAPVSASDGGVLANEVKTYKPWTTVGGQPMQNSVGLTDGIRQQVLKDSWLMSNIPGYNPRWNFIGAPPSAELDQYLSSKGIDYTIYH